MSFKYITEFQRLLDDLYVANLTVSEIDTMDDDLSMLAATINVLKYKLTRVRPAAKE